MTPGIKDVGLSPIADRGHGLLDQVQHGIAASVLGLARLERLEEAMALGHAGDRIVDTTRRQESADFAPREAGARFT